MDETHAPAENEAAVRALIEAWAAAVRRQDIDAILAHHSADMVMFDVPPPFQSKGIEAYRASWDLFFGWSTDPVPYEITEMTVTAGEDVAFAVATMRCAEPGPGGEPKPLAFRLTIGLRKIDGRWTIVHEHHSVPAVG
jgi:uncharacterized protein (TIGR02246 family)